MKISKQEQIFIIIFIVAAILGVGFFVFLLPNFNNIDVNNKNLESTKNQYAELQAKLEHEATIDDEIKTAYEEGKNLADSFYDDLTTYEADEIMRQFIARGENITIDGLSVSPFSTSTLSITTFTPTEITYPLKDFANTVVQQEEEVIDITKMTPRERLMHMKKLTSVLLAASEPVTVGSITVSFTAHSDKLENLHAFVDLLNEGVYDENIKDKDGKPQRKATYMSNVSFELAEKADKLDNKDEANKENANPENDGANGNKKEEDFSMGFSVQFYCIKPVADPFANQTAAQ